MSSVDSLRHLITRFFGVLVSRPLTPQQQDWVNEHLGPAEAELFWQQSVADQAHAHAVARRTEAVLGENRKALAAALLHDVGKRHSAAGPIGRSLATVLDFVHVPMPEDWRRYREHGKLGAQDLSDIGADVTSIAFARGQRDEAVDQQVWDALVSADNA